MSSKRKDLYSGIFFLFFAVFIYIVSYSIKMSRADALGPQFFPRLVAITMAVLAIIQIVRCAGALRREATPQKSAGEPFWRNMPLLLSIALLAGYVLLVDTLGFMIVTAIYLFGQIFLLLPKGAIRVRRNIIVAAAVSLLVPVGVYYLFYKVFMIFLPAGILG